MQIEIQQSTNESKKSFNQNIINKNGEVDASNDDPEEKFMFEDALLPDNLKEIQTLYDSENDILTYSSNYEVYLMFFFYRSNTVF